jgi:hypothetical protein
MTTLLLLCFLGVSQAQIYTVKITAAHIDTLLGSAARVSIPSMNVAAPNEQAFEELRSLDSLNNAQGNPPNIAVEVKANISTATNGIWTKSGTRNLWLLQVRSTGARALAPIFEQLDLGKGTIWLFSANKKWLMGPITAQTLPQKLDEVKTDFLDGESFVVAYFSPTKTDIKISGLDYIYGKEQKNGDGYLGSLSCEIDASGQEGDCFRFERQATAVLLFDKRHTTSVCTGTMVNNTKNDFRPLLLSSHHCFYKPFGNEDLEYDLPTMRVRFKWWTDRIVVTNPQYWPFSWYEFEGHVTFTGLKMLAHSKNNADFALTQLVEPILPENEITYLGWSKVSTPKSSTVLHHPAGDFLKIAQSYLPCETTTTDNGGIRVADRGWAVKWDLGFTEGGSSGSALLNENHLICGQISQALFDKGLIPTQNCANGIQPSGDVFGRLDVSWDGGGSANNRLSDHLAPSITADELNATFQMKGRDQMYYCESATYAAPNISTSNGSSYIYQWQVSPNLRINSVNGSTATVTPINNPNIGEQGWVEAEIFEAKGCTGLSVGKSRKTIALNREGNIGIYNRNDLNIVTYGVAFVRTFDMNVFHTYPSYANTTDPNTVYTWNVQLNNGYALYYGNNTRFDIQFFSVGNAVVTVPATTTVGGVVTCIRQTSFPVVTNGTGCSGCSGIVQGADSTATAQSISRNNGDINNTEDVSFVTYPNPIQSEKLSIKFLGDVDKDNSKEVAISDMNGKIIKVFYTTDMYSQLDVADIPTGIYTITAKSAQAVSTQKLVVQH